MMFEDVAPGSVAHLGHPDNGLLVAKTDYGHRWVYLTGMLAGDFVESEDFRAGWRPIFMLGNGASAHEPNDGLTPEHLIRIKAYELAKLEIVGNSAESIASFEQNQINRRTEELIRLLTP